MLEAAILVLLLGFTTVALAIQRHRYSTGSDVYTTAFIFVAGVALLVVSLVLFAASLAKEFLA